MNWKKMHQNGCPSMDAAFFKCLGIHLITGQDPWLIGICLILSTWCAISLYMWNKSTFANFLFLPWLVLPLVSKWSKPKILLCFLRFLLKMGYYVPSSLHTFWKFNCDEYFHIFLRKFYPWHWKYVPFSQERSFTFISEGTNIAIW